MITDKLKNQMSDVLYQCASNITTKELFLAIFFTLIVSSLAASIALLVRYGFPDGSDSWRMPALKPKIQLYTLVLIGAAVVWSAFWLTPQFLDRHECVATDGVTALPM